MPLIFVVCLAVSLLMDWFVCLFLYPLFRRTEEVQSRGSQDYCGGSYLVMNKRTRMLVCLPLIFVVGLAVFLLMDCLFVCFYILCLEEHNRCNLEEAKITAVEAS